MNIKVRDEIVKTDFLIIGGGVAGMQAAISAAELGTDVIVAEKADTRRSGGGCGGNDHFMCYIPECHGDDINRMLKEVNDTLEGGPWQDPSMLKKMMLHTEEIVRKWESYGIKMRPTGDWIFEGHSLPGNQRYHLKYDGSNQKMALTKKALKEGAKIMNKVYINEILKNEENRVVGAIGFSIVDDEPEMIIFQAKAILLATAHALRMYPGTNPAYIFNTNGCPASAGGAAIGYRAGAKLVNVDIPYLHAGPKGFARSGKGTWIGVISDSQGKPVGPYVTKPTRETGDPLADIWTSVFEDKLSDGSGPTYMNCTQLSDDDLEYMKRQFISEGIDSITDYLEQHHIDLQKSMIEFGTYDYALQQRGIDIDLYARTNIEGLYGAGICCGNVRGNVTSASVWGDIAAVDASEYVKTVSDYDVSQHPMIQEKVELYNALLNREEGADWLEANSTLQRIMNDYVGLKIRSESMMKAGLKYLGDLKEYAHEEIQCHDAHELMRTMELFDLIDLAEAVALTSENRKESRGKHHRVDYTFTNPVLNGKFQTIEKLPNGEVKMEFRERF